MIKVSTSLPHSVNTESNLVLFVFEKGKRPAGSFLFGSTVDKSFELAKQDGFSGRLGQVQVVRPRDQKFHRIFFAGLGLENESNLDQLRQASAAAARMANGMGLKTLTIRIPQIGSPENAAQATVEGANLGIYKFNEFKSTPDSNSKLQAIVLVGKDAAELRQLAEGQRKGTLFADAVTFARDLINRPPSDTTPAYLVHIAKSIAKGRTSMKVFNKAQLQIMGMGALLGVNRGSHQPPYFLHLVYKPVGKPKRKIGICGKGITFDSGGLSLKPAGSMETMKYDMSGAATVLSLFRAIMQLRPSVELHGFVPMTENMPGGNAVKPGDVLKAYNGKTIEVLNTDAEGRLILADALSYASEQNLDEVFDIATLTGACVVALGKQIVGLLGNNPAFLDRVRKASALAGEKVWELPLEKEYLALLKSPVADLKNIGPAGEAGTIMAGLFLNEFVGKNLPWAHLDIASTGWTNTPTSLSNTGATGVMIRTLLTYLTSL